MLHPIVKEGVLRPLYRQVFLKGEPLVAARVSRSMEPAGMGVDILTIVRVPMSILVVSRLAIGLFTSLLAGSRDTTGITNTGPQTIRVGQGDRCSKH